MQRIKKGDLVIVGSGKDKGKSGYVERVIPSREMLVISGVNLLSKHVKENPNKGIQGGIVKREAPLHQSKVALFESSSAKGGKVMFKVQADGKKVRCFRRGGAVVGS